jgi:hypothetical protein
LLELLGGDDFWQYLNLVYYIDSLFLDDDLDDDCSSLKALAIVKDCDHGIVVGERFIILILRLVQGKGNSSLILLVMVIRKYFYFNLIQGRPI